MTLEIDRIYCGDCLDLMREIPDKSVDLVLTDPPYGIGASTASFMRCGQQHGAAKAVSGLNYDPAEWDNSRVPEETFKEIMRVSKNQIIFGGNLLCRLSLPNPVLDRMG